MAISSEVSKAAVSVQTSAWQASECATKIMALISVDVFASDTIGYVIDRHVDSLEQHAKDLESAIKALKELRNA